MRELVEATAEVLATVFLLATAWYGGYVYGVVSKVNQGETVQFTIYNHLLVTVTKPKD